MLRDRIKKGGSRRHSRRALSPERSRVPHVVLIDDDPLFSDVMTKIGKHRGIEVTACRTLSDLAVLTVAHVFDAAIIDLYLDGLKDALRGTDLARVFKETPVILVSRSSEENREFPRKEDWPNSIKAFVTKSDGPDAILSTALVESNAHRLKVLAQG